MPGASRELTNETDFPRVETLDGTEVMPAVRSDGSPVGVAASKFAQTADLDDALDAFDDRLTAAEGLVAAGVNFSAEVVVVRTTANVNLASGLTNGTTINGHTLATGEYVFVGSQSSAAENGLYTVPASGVASRAAWADSAAELERIGFLIRGGTVGAGEKWLLPLDAADITLGTTALNFALYGLEQDGVADVDEARDGEDTLHAAIIRPLRRGSLWPDPTFKIARGNAHAYTLAGPLYPGSAQYSNMVWDDSIETNYGKGAWVYNTSLTTYQGFLLLFKQPGFEYKAGDVFSIGIRIKAASGTVGVYGRYVTDYGSSGAPSFGAEPQVGFDQGILAMDGTEKLFTLNNKTIPSGYIGMVVYALDGTSSAFSPTALWTALGADAGSEPSVRDALSQLFGLQEQSVPGRAGLRSAVDSLLDRVSYSTLSAYAAASSIFISGQSQYNGFGEKRSSTHVTGDVDGVRIPALTGNVANTKIHTLVRTASANSQYNTATLLGYGYIDVDPEDTDYGELVIPFVDRMTGELTSIPAASFDAEYYVHVWGSKADGSMGDIDVPRGTVADRITSHYTYQKADPLIATPLAYSGNPTLSPELVSLSDKEKSFALSRKMKTALTDSFANLTEGASAALTSPASNEPVIPAKINGLEGIETNIYLQDSVSNTERVLFRVTGPSTFGKQQNERWTFTPTGANTAQDITIATLHPSELYTLHSKTCSFKSVADGAASGATKRVMCIGDSTTNAAVYVQRCLDLMALNANNVQITFVGTRGSGAALHEGRGGWTVDRYFDPGTTYYSDNPFTQNDGDKFSAAYYHSNTGFAVADIYVLALGINDIFNTGSTMSDLLVAAKAAENITKLDKMIGLVADASVGAIRTTAPSAKIIIAVPISPAQDQDAFGHDYNITYNRDIYKRAHLKYTKAILDHYEPLSGSGVYVLPWHICIDPEFGWTRTTELANAVVSDTVDRQDNSVHPSATGGYLQMGDMLYADINEGVVNGRY